jgi:5-methylcytosine-specific restriction endonuclease McrA
MNGEITGYIGKAFVTTAPFVRRWVIERAGGKCERCGWNTPHPVSGVPPLQVHHKDGDALNTRPENLECLCPNCHSLTENYGSRNEASTKDFTYIRERGYRSIEHLTSVGTKVAKWA